MKKIPDYLYAEIIGALNKGQRAGKVVNGRRTLDQVPSQPFPRRKNSCRLFRRL